MIYFLFIILGLAVGSFLNAVIYRLPRGISVLKGRSFCPNCGHTLSVDDLVPLVSFISLKGRCRYCSKSIAWQYPLIEVGTSVIFLIVYLRFGLTPNFLVYLVYSLILLVIFMIDFRNYLILDSVALPAVILTFLLNLFVVKLSSLGMILAGITGGGFFFVQFLLSGGRWVGGGDIRLGFLMGVMLGDWGKLGLALLLSYVGGAITGIILILLRKKRFKSKMPLGVFLSAATFFVMLLGDQVLYWNLGIFL